ncbi:transposable element Tcb1 transposase [Trichonephila clavipes]|nr:transposable element Tcb1 transposase [Trichonephila clavipes]
MGPCGSTSEGVGASHVGVYRTKPPSWPKRKHFAAETRCTWRSEHWSRNRRSTASDLSRQLSSTTGTTVSRQPVYRRLGHFGLYARKPVRCVPLTVAHCRQRLTWSREHALWTPQQWSCVMFSDESRFSLQSDSRRTLIWRAPGTRYRQENTTERHRCGGAGWLVWGRIILGSRTDLHVQSVTMTGHIYRDVILEQHVRLFRGAMVLNFCLWMTTPVLTVQTLQTNAFNRRISPVWIGQHTHRT